jgi:pimeloyl-ACP methyl ester carboxylesterase
MYKVTFIKQKYMRGPAIGLHLLVAFACLLPACSYYFYRPGYADIHEFRMLEVNDIRQAVLVRGSDDSNPVLVYLHGGPGFPLFPFEPAGETMQRLEEDFTVVYWEQRGTGKSFSRAIPSHSMSIDQFVEDARLVTNYALELTGQEKAFIWGHSWGSGVGAILAARHPELVEAFISTGQSVNPYLNERLGYEFVRERALQENNRRALRQLQWIDTIPDNYTLDDALTIRRWVYRFGGVVRQSTHERPYVDLREIVVMLTAPEYSFGERLNLILSPLYSAEKLWDEMKKLDLNRDAPRIEVPVYFLLGRHDVIVSSELAAAYFAELQAPAGKALYWFEESAHRPQWEEREKFLEVMKGIRNSHFQDPGHFQDSGHFQGPED